MGCRESDLSSVSISPPCTFLQDEAWFGVCRNLGQIITLLPCLQRWGADLKLTFSGPRTGRSPSLAKAAAKASGTVCHPPAC